MLSGSVSTQEGYHIHRGRIAATSNESSCHLANAVTARVKFIIFGAVTVVYSSQHGAMLILSSGQVSESLVMVAARLSHQMMTEFDPQTP